MFYMRTLILICGLSAVLPLNAEEAAPEVATEESAVLYAPNQEISYAEESPLEVNVAPPSKEQKSAAPAQTPDERAFDESLSGAPIEPQTSLFTSEPKDTKITEGTTQGATAIPTALGPQAGTTAAPTALGRSDQTRTDKTIKDRVYEWLATSFPLSFLTKN